MATPGARLRALIDKGEHFIAGEAFSALTGRIAQHVGFPAAYMGGHACSAFHYAVPDNGVFSQVEMIEQSARIAQVLDIPLIADADTLGETVADAYHFTRRYIRAGVGGYHVEDEVNPKHSRYVNGLCSIADMQARIDAGVRARRDVGQDFVIIARCDELYPSERGGGGTGSLEEAIRRGQAYVEAGADVLFFPPMPTQVPELVKAFPNVPVATMGFTIPGAAFNMATGTGWIGAAKLHLARQRELFETGKMSIAPEDMAFPEKYELIDQPFYDDLIAEWADKTGRQSRPNSAR
ncbi:MAG: isocitrate lyase/PEP mutase family protein [Sphingomonadales bacterium]|nr:isocitrate lyase/PEP mutase family protein [Sphingomonadales bacterium]